MEAQRAIYSLDNTELRLSRQFPRAQLVARKLLHAVLTADGTLGGMTSSSAALHAPTGFAVYYLENVSSWSDSALPSIQSTLLYRWPCVVVLWLRVVRLFPGLSLLISSASHSSTLFILDYCRRDHSKLTPKSCLYLPRCLYCLPRATGYAFDVIP